MSLEVCTSSLLFVCSSEHSKFPLSFKVTILFGPRPVLFAPAEHLRGWKWLTEVIILFPITMKKNLKVQTNVEWDAPAIHLSEGRSCLSKTHRLNVHDWHTASTQGSSDLRPSTRSTSPFLLPRWCASTFVAYGQPRATIRGIYLHPVHPSCQSAPASWETLIVACDCTTVSCNLFDLGNKGTLFLTYCWFSLRFLFFSVSFFSAVHFRRYLDLLGHVIVAVKSASFDRRSGRFVGAIFIWDGCCAHGSWGALLCASQSKFYFCFIIFAWFFCVFCVFWQCNFLILAIWQILVHFF